MKKLLITGLISGLFSAGAMAAACTGTGGAQTAGAVTGGTTNTEQCVCNGGVGVTSTVNGGKSAALATSPIFLVRGFDVQCSANTIVSYNEVSPTAFGVGSGSVKGNQTFQGSSAGGGVSRSADCAATGCTAANVTTATAAAAVAAAS